MSLWAMAFITETWKIQLNVRFRPGLGLGRLAGLVSVFIVQGPSVSSRELYSGVTCLIDGTLKDGTCFPASHRCNPRSVSLRLQS